MDSTDWISQGQQQTDAFQQALMQRANGGQYATAYDPQQQITQALQASGMNNGQEFGSNTPADTSQTTDQNSGVVGGNTGTQTGTDLQTILAQLTQQLQNQNGLSGVNAPDNGLFGNGTSILGSQVGPGQNQSGGDSTANTEDSTTGGQVTGGQSTPASLSASGGPTANQTAVAKSMGFSHFDPTTQSFTASNGVSIPLSNAIFNGSASPGNPAVALSAPSSPLSTPSTSGGTGIPTNQPAATGFTVNATGVRTQQQPPSQASQMQNISQFINSWRGSQAGLQQALHNMGASSSFANALLGKGGGGGAPVGGGVPAPAPAPQHTPAPTPHGVTSIMNGGVGITGTGYGGSNIGIGGSYVPNVTIGGYGGGAGQFGGSGGYNMAYNSGYGTPGNNGAIVDYTNTPAGSAPAGYGG